MPKIYLNQNEVMTAKAQQTASFPYFGTQDTNLAQGSLGSGGRYAPVYPIGSTWTLQGPAFTGIGGATFQYVKLVKGSTNIVQGDVVAWSDPTNVSSTYVGTVTAAGSTVSAIKTNITTVINEAGSLFYVLDATKGNFMRTVISSTVGANAIFTLGISPDSLVSNQGVPVEALPAIPTDGSACVILHPNQVVIYPTTVLPPCAGVAVQACTAGNFTIIQKTGYALVNGVGGGTAIVAGGPVVPSGVTAGKVIGSATYTTASVGLSGIAHASTVQLIPVLLTNVIA